MTRIFKFEDLACNEEVFKKVYQLAARKKGEIMKYLKDLVLFEYNDPEPIKEDYKEKFVFHSMILNLEDVNVLYDFFKDFQDQFAPNSKTAIKNICQK